MKKIFALFLFVVSFLTIQAQTPYDTVNVRDPQNFVEMTTVDTAYFQLIGRKANLNRRMSLTTLKNWILSGVSGIDSVYWSGDTLNILQGLTLWSAHIPNMRIASTGQLALDGYANNAMNNVDSSLYVLAVDATGDVHTRAASGLGADDLGDHTATQDLNMAGYDIAAADTIEIGSGAQVWKIWRDGAGEYLMFTYGQDETQATYALRLEQTGAMRIGGLDGYDMPTADGTAGQVLTTDGSGQASWGTGGGTIDSVFIRNDSIYISEAGTENFALIDPTGRNTSAPTSFGGDGVNIHFQPRVQLGLNNTWREEFPGIAYNPYTGRIVAVYRYADTHTYSTNGRGVAQYSDDFGKTWSDTVHFAVDRIAGEDKGVDPSITYDHKTRKYLAVGNRREDANNTNELAIIYESTNGETWATRDTITKPAGTKGFRALEPLQRLQDNRLAITGYTFDGAGADSSKLWFLHSSDDGETWAAVKIAQAANATANSPNESQLIQKPDGTIYVYARHDADQKTYRYASTDDGATWAAAVDVTPTSYLTTLGSKPSLHIFSDSILFSMYRKAGTTNGAAAYSISTDWGTTWGAVSDMPQSDSEARWYYAAYTRIDDNGAFLIYSEGQNTSNAGATAPKVYAQYFSSGGSATGEQVQVDVLQLREHTPGTLLEGATYYDGTSLRFQDASEVKTVAHAAYEAKTATVSTSLALGNVAFSYKKIDCDLSASFNLSLSGGIAGGQYKLHFQNADSTIINVPTSIRNLAGTVIGSAVVDSAGLFDCLHDGSVFHCAFTDVTPQYTTASFATIAEAVDYIGSPYLEINAALETEYADEAAVDTLHDFSGNGRHFAASGTARPTYDSMSATSSLPAFKLDGGDYATNTTKANWVFMHSDSTTIFAVLKPGNTADPNAAYTIMGSSGASSNNIGMDTWWDDRVSQSLNQVIRHGARRGNVPSGGVYVSNISNDDAMTANTYHSLAILFKPTALADSLERSKISVDGGAYIQNNTQPNSSNPLVASPSVSNATYDMQIGAAGNNVLPFVGEISVLIVWDRILSPSEISILQTAYENEYGP